MGGLSKYNVSGVIGDASMRSNMLENLDKETLEYFLCRLQSRE
jgi:hypothetical protein